MRKVTAGLFHSVDGVVEAPNLWQFDAFDDDLGSALEAVQSRVDAVLMGRVGYQEWSSYWPNADADVSFKDFINGVPKHVASRTLTGDLEWQNATLIDGSLEAFVAELKNSDGGEISVMASISLVRQLLFEPADPITRLELTDSKQTSKGNIIQTYRRRAD